MQLARVILFQLAETPMTAAHMTRWVRIQHPRVLPDAVGAALCTLRTEGWIECVAGKWRVLQKVVRRRR